MKRIYALLGLLFLGLGCVGVALPILPTAPFLMLAAFFFAKGSRRLNDWFLSTKLYKRHVAALVKRREMTARAKLTLIATITAVMGFGFLMMSRVPAARWILAAVWLAHVLYFGFRVKTAKEGPQEEPEQQEQNQEEAESRR